MDTKVELFASKGKTLIQRRKQHILSATQLVHRDGQQSVIASCIARHDRRVAVRTSLVCNDELTLKRVLKVDKLGLVEFKKSHTCLYLSYLIYLLQNQSASARKVKREGILVFAVSVFAFDRYTKMHLSSPYSGEAVKFVFI